jgi:phosphate transport system substrate-binding protein
MNSDATILTMSVCRPLSWVLLAAAICLPVLPAVAQQRDGLEVQRGRQEKLAKRGNQTYYEAHWSLDDLPAYQPEQQVSGTIRQWGSNYFSDSPLNTYWEEGFRTFHPGVSFADDERTTLAAIPSLAFGLADLAPSRHITFDETLFFQRYKSRSPVEITAVTGSLNVPGWNYALGIYVNKDNPLTGLSIEQLDGIFGAQRDGGYDGTTWRIDIARGPEKNIRSWGELGLSGAWADKPIDVYGYNLRYHIPRTFERLVFQGGDKWNEQMHEFANYKNADGTTELEGQQTLDAVGRDRYGIAYSSMAFGSDQVKVLPLAARGSSDYVALNLETVRARTYPLIDEVYFYLDRQPGKPIDPKVREFLRYILSREGQRAVQRDGKFMPLTAAVVREQLKKLD